MIELTPLIFILITHFIGDFVFQTRWMARNKSSSIYALFLHVFTYSVTLAIPFIWMFDNMDMWFFFIFINFFLHGVTDFCTSRLTRKYYLEMKASEEKLKYPLEYHSYAVQDMMISEKNFYMTLGFDQLIHMLTLVLTYYWMS